MHMLPLACDAPARPSHATMSTGLYFHHPVCLEHDPRVHMPGHPDTPERLQAIEAAWPAPTGSAGSGARARRPSESSSS